MTLLGADVMTQSKTPLQMVAEFHEAFDVARRDFTTESLQFREDLIIEEHDEVQTALTDLEYHTSPALLQAAAKELADLVYVVYGTADVLGIDLDRVLEEVHRSNMSKLGQDGKPVLRQDGKVLKGPLYKQADLSFVG